MCKFLGIKNEASSPIYFSCYLLRNVTLNYTLNAEYCKSERAKLITLRSQKVANFLVKYHKHKITSGEWTIYDSRRPGRVLRTVKPDVMRECPRETGDRIRCRVILS